MLTVDVLFVRSTILNFYLMFPSQFTIPFSIISVYLTKIHAYSYLCEVVGANNYYSRSSVNDFMPLLFNFHFVYERKFTYTEKIILPNNFFHLLKLSFYHYVAFAAVKLNVQTSIFILLLIESFRKCSEIEIPEFELSFEYTFMWYFILRNFDIFK